MFQNKLVAVVNKQIETGVVMNALAHMSLGFGAHKGAAEMHLMDYTNADGFVYPNISKMPFIILREKNSNKIADLLEKAIEAGIQYSVFTNTMTEGTWEDQKARTLSTKSVEIIYYGIVLYGPKETVTEMTKNYRCGGVLMSNPLTGSPKKVQDFLIANGFSCTVKELPDSTRTAQEAAKAIGCDVGQIAKSLIFVDQLSDHPILIIASGINQVDIKKVESSTGLKLTKADGKLVKEKVGFAIGGVPPVGHLEKLKTFLDPTLKNYEWIWAAAGTPFTVFRLSSKEIQKMTEGEFIVLAQD